MRLTDKIVAALAEPTQGNARTQDSEVRGFCAVVTASGHRSFALRYRLRGRQRLYTIGSFPTWRTTTARYRARELRRMVDQGIDPLEEEADAEADEERAKIEALSVAQFWWRIYEPLHVVNKRWAVDVRSIMRNDVLPVLGDRPVKDVDHADVVALHRKISRRAPGRANRVLAVISHLMNYAERPHVDQDGERVPALRPQYSNPARGVAKNPEEARQRFLSAAELARLAAVLDQHPERVSVALTRFLLLTGSRFGEASRATWDQLDLERGTWTKPSSHTKQKRVHSVPLSAPALALLAELREQGASDCLFPGPTGKPIATIRYFWYSVCRQAQLENVRLHDLRHSFASLLVNAGASLPLIGSLLGHTQVATTARYSHLLDSAQRAAVERVGALVGGTESAAVVPLHRAR